MAYMAWRCGGPSPLARSIRRSMQSRCTLHHAAISSRALHHAAISSRTLHHTAISSRTAHASTCSPSARRRRRRWLSTTTTEPQNTHPAVNAFEKAFNSSTATTTATTKLAVGGGNKVAKPGEAIVMESGFYGSESHMWEKDIRSTSGDVEDPKLIFEIAWKNTVDTYGDENMVFPKDIMWLSGAPGAGKGHMTEFIMKTRGITAPPIVTSDLLHSPEAQAIKARGDLVADRHVVQLVLQKLLEPQYASGVIVDGYPRTRVQGECIKLLYDKMQDYRRKYEGLPNSPFRRPIFHITVLFVEEDLSVQRQMTRGEKVRQHNKTVEETGVGSKKELRKTDIDEHLARERYRQFKELIYESLQSIKEKFFFHFISADGSPELVQERIMAELKYQSLFELHELTFEKVRRLPLASEIIENARYELVRRLDQYTREHPQLLDRVIDVLSTDFFPIIRLQALSGKAIIRSENPVFDEKNALNMALDLFSERGYTAVLDFHKRRYPQRVDNEGLVKLRDRRIFEFHIEFAKPTIRHTRHEMTS